MGELKRSSSSIVSERISGHNDKRTYSGEWLQGTLPKGQYAPTDEVEVLPCRVLSFDLKRNLDLH